VLATIAIGFPPSFRDGRQHAPPGRSIVSQSEHLTRRDG
jgi:hypothetical protein